MAGSVIFNSENARDAEVIKDPDCVDIAEEAEELKDVLSILRQSKILPVDFSVSKSLQYGATCDAFVLTMWGKKHFLKMLKPEYRDSEKYLNIIRREFLTCYPLDHPSIPRYLQAGKEFIIMDNIEGFSLDEFVEKKTDYFRNESNVRRFLKQLLSGLIYLHESDIIHGDLKPENIMMTKVCHNVKIVDFGFSYSIGFSKFMGSTKRFCAPEVWEYPERGDRCSDIYSFGKILQWLDLYPRIADRCTKESPDDRYQSCEEIAEEMGIMPSDQLYENFPGNQKKLRTDEFWNTDHKDI